MNKKIHFEKISMHQGPEKSPGFLLWHLSTSWRRMIENMLKSFNLTHPQFVVLAATGWLTRNDHLATQIAIGNMADLDPNTNSQILKGLEKKNLIQRTPSSDGRAKNVSLTFQGKQTLNRALPAVESEDAKFFSFLETGERALLIEMFHKALSISLPP